VRNGRRQFYLITAVATIASMCWIPLASSRAGDAPTSAPAATATVESPKIPDKFADADAVILRWEQSWKQAGDGTITQHELKHVLVRNDRCYGAVGDPRITYNQDWQTVKVLVARTRTPDGRVVDVPAYSRNDVAPYESAGWPAFAGIRQIVLTMSALEPGAVIELEWERVTKPGMKAALEVDECLEAEFPCLSRAFSIEAATRASATATDIPALIEEPQSLSHSERGRWFFYSSDQSQGLDRLGKRFKSKDDQAGDGAAFKPVIDEWCKGKAGDQEKAKEIQSRLAQAVHFVGVREEYLPDAMRKPMDVLKSRYASPSEGAALLLALFKAAGLNARPFAMMERMPLNRGDSTGIANVYFGHSAIEWEGVAIGEAEAPSVWHPAHGRVFDNSDTWMRSRIQWIDGKAAGILIRPPGQLSAMDIQVMITVAEDGAWTGRATVEAARVFRRGKDLMTEDQRRGFAAGVVERVLPKAEVTKVAVLTLSDDQARLAVEIKSREPLAMIDGCRMLTLAQDGPWSRDVSIPMKTSTRKTTMRIADAFTQSIKMTVEFPKAWTPIAAPRPIGAKDAADAFAWQTVDVSAGRAEFEQRITVGACTIEPAQYDRLRSALTELQTDSARTLLWKTAEADAKKVH